MAHITCIAVEDVFGGVRGGVGNILAEGNTMGGKILYEQSTISFWETLSLFEMVATLR